ncbi:MAG: DUF2142 domain-containing protein [Solirubrobacterales bacterium]
MTSVPTAGWICAIVACLNATAWSFVTPPFQVSDEPSHFAYVKQFADTGHLPSSSSEVFSTEEILILSDLHYDEIREQPNHQSISSNAAVQKLQSDLKQTEESRGGSRAAAVATGEPPLYYALESIPYDLASKSNLLTRLQLMRLLSALMCGVTGLFVFLFIREVLPQTSWAWIVGGLSIALTPLLGFASGAVNPEVMIYTISAALFYCFAKAFRGGLTPKLAIAIGAVTALGFLTKLSFVGLAPGMLIGLVYLTYRDAQTSRRMAYRCFALATSIAVAPVVVYVLLNAIASQPLGGAIANAANASVNRSIPGEIDYIWQFYLPRLPGMPHDFPGIFTTRQLWFNAYIGLYGWLDTTFPSWVYDVALIPAGAIAFLCLRALVVNRAALRRRLPELAVYGCLSVGVMAIVGAASYAQFPAIDAEYRQARYMLPLVPLLGLVCALAARGAGRRWGPVAGAMLVLLVFAHDIFSQLLVISRYYA